MTAETSDLRELLALCADHLAKYRAYSEAMSSIGRGCSISSPIQPDHLERMLTAALDRREAPLTVGDFVRIPAWQVQGMVSAIRPSDLGTERAIAIDLQDRPDGPVRRYRLEPDEYEVV